MSTESWKAYNPDATKKHILEDRLRISFRITNNTIRRVREINKDIVNDFTKAYQTRIAFVEDVKGEVEIEKILDIIQDYEILKNRIGHEGKFGFFINYNQTAADKDAKTTDNDDKDDGSGFLPGFNIIGLLICLIVICSYFSYSKKR